MNARQAGFTLIELVMVIVILGILAAAAIPKFVNMQGEAQTAATQGVAGALGSASAINYAVRSVGTGKGSAIADCDDVKGVLEGGLPAGYTITTPAAIAAGATATCTLNGPNSTTATFVGHGIL